MRGYRTFDGKRVWTSYYRTKVLAGEAHKRLKAPIETFTIRVALDGFLATAVIAASTRGGSEHTANHYLAALHGLNCDQLTFKKLNDHYVGLRDSGLASSTIRQAHAVLKGALAFALNNGWVEQNVAASVKLPPARRTKVEGLTVANREAVLAQLVGHPFEGRFRLGLLWGLRPGEATGLRWSSVDFERGTVRIVGQLQRSNIDVDGVKLGTIYRAATKSDAGGRTIWADEETMRVLAARRHAQADDQMGRFASAGQVHQRSSQGQRILRAKALHLLDDPDLYTSAPDDLVFTLPNGDPILSTFDADMWKALLVAAQVPHVRLYAARHTAANHLLVSGAPLSAVSAVMGHSSQQFTQRVYGGSLDVLSDGLAAYL